MPDPRELDHDSPCPFLAGVPLHWRVVDPRQPSSLVGGNTEPVPTLRKSQTASTEISWVVIQTSSTTDETHNTEVENVSVNAEDSHLASNSPSPANNSQLGTRSNVVFSTYLKPPGAVLTGATPTVPTASRRMGDVDKFRVRTDLAPVFRRAERSILRKVVCRQ